MIRCLERVSSPAEKVERRNAYVLFLRVRDARPISPGTINIIELGSGVVVKLPEYEAVSDWVPEQTPPGQKKAWIWAGVWLGSMAEKLPLHGVGIPTPSLTVPLRLRAITVSSPCKVKTSGKPG